MGYEFSNQDRDAIKWVLITLHFLVVLRALKQLISKKKTGFNFQVKFILFSITAMCLCNGHVVVIIELGFGRLIDKENITLIDILHCIILIAVVSVVNYIFISVYIELSIELDELLKKRNNKILGISFSCYCLIFGGIMITFLEIGNQDWMVYGNAIYTITLIDYAFRAISISLLGISSFKLNRRLSQIIVYGDLRKRKTFSNIRFIFLTFFPMLFFLVINTFAFIYIKPNNGTVE